VTEEEIKTLVDAGSEEGVIEDEEKEMIYSIFQFCDKVAREVMVPRIDMVALDADGRAEQPSTCAVRRPLGAFPIYEETIDKIVGCCTRKICWSSGGTTRAGAARSARIIRPAYFVPESKKAGSLLEELQQRKIHMAIVDRRIRRYGCLVTIEDLGRRNRRRDPGRYDPDEEAEYQKISDDEYLFDASIPH